MNKAERDKLAHALYNNGSGLCIGLHNLEIQTALSKFYQQQEKPAQPLGGNERQLSQSPQPKTVNYQVNTDGN